MMNGLHTESLSPPVLARYFEFLQLYVAKEVPNLAPLAAIAPALGSTIWGVDRFAPFESRFTGMTYRRALNEFESEPAVRILFEQGGNATYSPGTPEPNFVAEFPSWPIPTTEPKTWLLDGEGNLASGAPIQSGESSYIADPTALPQTFYTGGSSSDIWKAGTQYDWEPIPDGTGVGFVTAPLADDMVIAGPGSVDLWIKSTSPDTDLEATVSEVRPDGQEIYVQSGWLRASQRALAVDSASDLRPAHTNLEADAADLPTGEFTLVRIELFPFAHPFRAGSRVRLTIDAPGNSRAVWAFRTIDNGEKVTIADYVEHPSKLVLAVIPGVAIPKAAPPACGSLRGQPCRRWVRAANGG